MALVIDQPYVLQNSAKVVEVTVHIADCHC